MSILDDSARWRERAEEARTMADEMKDPEARRTLLEIAVSYGKLAERAERRNNSKHKG